MRHSSPVRTSTDVDIAAFTPASGPCGASRVLRDVATMTSSLSRWASSSSMAFVGFDRRLFEHGGDGLRVIVEGMRNEPALAAAYEEGRGRGERTRRQAFSTWPAAAPRRGVIVQRALDMYAVTVSIQAYDIATRERSWAPDRVERWWVETLAEQLLD
jgi:hypothetical protein